MTTPENTGSDSVNSSVNAESTAGVGETCTKACAFHRPFWMASLAVIGTGMALHGALAYSPELANYVPESVVCSSSEGCPIAALMHGGRSAKSSCQSSAAGCSSMASGCCSMGDLSSFALEMATRATADDVAELPADALSPVASGAN